MKLLFLGLYILTASVACNCSKKAQKLNAATVTTIDSSASAPDNTIIEQPMSPIGVFFTSMASGPASDEFLKEWVSGYIQKNNITLASANRYSGCGKEGEYVVLLNMGNISPEKMLDFRAALEAVVKSQVEKNRAVSSSSGPINVEYGVKEDRYSYCRLGGKKWL